MTITITPAQPGDEPIVRDLQADAVGWLAEKGSDQWQPAAMLARNASRPEGRNLRDEIRRGEVYIVKQDGAVVGTVSLDDYADPEFWTEDDEPKSALYVHRMIVSREAAGHGLGAVMLDWAAGQAAHAGKRWLRLDAWRTNTALHDYYRRQGFDDVRVIDLPWRGSGALFQRAVRPVDAADGEHGSPLSPDS